MTTFLLPFLASLLAFLASAFTGGGASLLLLPLLQNYLPVSQIPLTLTVGTTASSFMRIRLFWASIRWDVVKWFVPMSLPAVWLGSLLITYLNPVFLEICIGLAMVSTLGQIFSTGRQSSPSSFVDTRSKPWHIGLVGFGAGFLSGLTGAVGLLFNRFYFKWALSKESIIATRAANELIIHLFKLVIYLRLGLYSTVSIRLGLVVALAAILANLVMRKVLPLFSELAFRKIGYLAMVVAGVSIFAKSSRHLAQQEHFQWALVNDKESWESRWMWKNSSLALEWDWQEGLELEYAIPFHQLPIHVQQQIIASQIKPLLIEEVHSLSGKSYEVYYATGSTINSKEYEEPIQGEKKARQ